MNRPTKGRSGPVVVTGLGAVSAWGWSAAALWDGLLGGEARIDLPSNFDTTRQRTRLAGEAGEAPTSLAQSVSDWRRFSRADRFGVSAALEAVEAAGATEGEEGLGVFFGSSTAGMLEGESFYARGTGAEPGRLELRLLTSQQINGPGDATARMLGATGPVHTVSSACASGALAVGEALRALRDGEVEWAVAGGADSLCALTYAGFNALRAVDERPCRPFRADRAGLSLGEGGAALVLEPLERAKQRGVRPLAELVGFGASCDCHHMTAPHPEGAGAALAIERALADAGLDAEEVTFVNAHGTGTPLNDVAEWRALEGILGKRAAAVPTTSIKGSIGHLLGTAGAIEAVATVQSLVHGLLPPTPGDGDPDPELGVDLVLGEPRTLRQPGVGLSVSLAFGGANAALLFRGATSEGST